MKSIFKIFLGCIAALLCSLLIDVNSNTVKADEAMLFDGTCCKETSSLCVVGEVPYDDRYYQKEGPCGPEVPPLP